MVSHTEISVVRYLIRERNITVSQSFFRQIWFLQERSIYIYVPALINVHPLPWSCDTSLYKNLVSKIECNQISCFEFRTFHRDYDIIFIDRRSHGCSIDLQNRHPDCCYKHCDCGYHNQCVDGASKDGMVSRTIFHSF